MKMVLQVSRWLVALALVGAAGILPSCASMGGGMRYDALFPVSPVSAVSS